MMPLAPPAAGDEPVAAVEPEIVPLVTLKPTTQPVLTLAAPHPEKLLKARVLRKM